ncbi:MAG: hypothetical protein EBU84_05030 [Actinobacteria bacterium]|jgi:hypothetical protein|nr:hypothetical protein [Actinomycetota bacterium]
MFEFDERGGGSWVCGSSSLGVIMGDGALTGPNTGLVSGVVIFLYTVNISMNLISIISMV